LRDSLFNPEEEVDFKLNTPAIESARKTQEKTTEEVFKRKSYTYSAEAVTKEMMQVKLKLAGILVDEVVQLVQKAFVEEGAVSGIT
jgi:hypothetical protein